MSRAVKFSSLQKKMHRESYAMLKGASRTVVIQDRYKPRVEVGRCEEKSKPRHGKHTTHDEAGEAKTILRHACPHLKNAYPLRNSYLEWNYILAFVKFKHHICDEAVR